jgi:nucleolar complex protein 3
MEEDSFGNSEVGNILSDQDSETSVQHNPDEEMPYETIPRIRRRSWDSEDKPAVRRLPIKLADGRIRQTGVHFSALQSEDSDGENDWQKQDVCQELPPVEDVSTGARFGRAAVVDVVRIPSKNERIQSAREQIAGICQDILSDPENSVSSTTCIRTIYLRDRFSLAC